VKDATTSRAGHYGVFTELTPLASIRRFETLAAGLPLKSVRVRGDSRVNCHNLGTPKQIVYPTLHPEAPTVPPRNEEAVPQFKITTKRSADRTLYRKTSIRFREISNYGTDSELRGILGGWTYLFFHALFTFISSVFAYKNIKFYGFVKCHGRLGERDNPINTRLASVASIFKIKLPHFFIRLTAIHVKFCSFTPDSHRGIGKSHPAPTKTTMKQSDLLNELHQQPGQIGCHLFWYPQFGGFHAP